MHVVVTGGSSGIGLEVARAYAARGAQVSLIARDPVRLEAARQAIESVSSSTAHVFTASADTGKDDELSSALAACEAAFDLCDILVASAGVVEPGWFYAQQADVFDAQWQTNFSGVINTVRKVYPGMRARGEGRIMIVSSAAAFIGLPAYSAYCASKAALVGFADALRLEAVGTGVSVGICFPPDTDTPQLQRELQARPKEAELLMGQIRPRPAGEIAARIVRGIDRRSARVYFTASIAALALFGPIARPFIEIWYRFQTRR
ncbi:SDR family NAD(P)-dependent oxidoreductase [Neorhizobium sp. NCHU2750]|uniref:SDR family NAD(P)-dependent oxidoreductase n=1 Tax=Neorhizobium sp. NCHU2750 TaxID=1825976 RepID=UPI000E72FEEE|nr:follicular variant translocation protein 1 [Neorhizobium sp. NCHU2750]